VIVGIDNRSEFDIELKKFNNIVELIMNKLGLKNDQEISISFVNENEMTDLHQKWMNEAGPTDVMSFRLSEISPVDKSLGDVVICPAVAIKDSNLKNESPARHLVFLMVHGLLHLAGMDHQKLSERLKMQKKERFLMAQIESEFKK
jgi:probable rRNA maturation factor